MYLTAWQLPPATGGPGARQRRPGAGRPPVEVVAALPRPHRSSGRCRSTGSLAVPVTLAASLLLWTSIPWLLLDRRVAWRRLLPAGAADRHLLEPLRGGVDHLHAAPDGDATASATGSSASPSPSWAGCSASPSSWSPPPSWPPSSTAPRSRGPGRVRRRLGIDGRRDDRPGRRGRPEGPRHRPCTTRSTGRGGLMTQQAPGPRRGRRGGVGTGAADAGVGAVPDDARQLGDERVDRDRRRGRRHDGHRHPDRDHPLHAGDGLADDHRRQDRPDHRPQARLRDRLRDLRRRVVHHRARAEPARADHRLVAARGHRRRADHAGDRRAGRVELRPRRTAPRLRAGGRRRARSPWPPGR